MSMVCRPRASINFSASWAIASIVSGTVPLEEATPALLNRMTSRSDANPSVMAGSLSSRLPM
jgi:hypothetical protein